MPTKKTLGFKTWREERRRVNSEPGSRIHEVLSGKYDKEGRLVLEKVGEEDVYDRIQSYAEMTDINNIMKRYQQGEEDVLERTQGIYMDATSLPENMADLLNKLNHAEDEFEKLPPEIKNKYGDDFAQFICQFQIEDLMVEPETAVEKVVESEEKSDE